METDVRKADPFERDDCLCRSGKHAWLDPEDRKRCCNGFVRVQDVGREGLERIGVENIKFAQMWRGWIKGEGSYVS